MLLLVISIKDLREESPKKMNTCEVCFQSFSRKDSLKRHKESKHKHGVGYNGIKSSVIGSTAPESNVNTFLKQYEYAPRPQFCIQSLEKSIYNSKHPSLLDMQNVKTDILKDRYQRYEVYDDNTVKWKHPPFTCMLAGPTSCGKSCFTASFLKHLNELVDTIITEVVYCAPECSYPDLLECAVPVRYLDYIPDTSLFSDRRPRLIIIDDMMRESNDNIVDLFTKFSHHLSLSAIFTTQNIFHQIKGMRDISLNAHYIVAYKSPRDRVQFSTLARQICPGNTRYVIEAFEDATNVPYGYLVMDLTQTTPDHLRYRTNIFPDDNPHNIIYVPKNFNV